MTKTKEKEKQKRVKERQGTQHRHGRKRGSKEIKRRTQKIGTRGMRETRKIFFNIFTRTFFRQEYPHHPVETLVWWYYMFQVRNLQHQSKTVVQHRKSYNSWSWLWLVFLRNIVSVGVLLVALHPTVFWRKAKRLLGDVHPPPHHHRTPLLFVDLQSDQVVVTSGQYVEHATMILFQVRCSCSPCPRLCRRLPRSR